MVRINYGVWKKSGKESRRHFRCDHFIADIDPDDHLLVQDIISSLNPGWIIEGWVEVGGLQRSLHDR